MEVRTEEILVIYWEWIEGKHKGAKFWGAHSLENDGRIRDWPAMGLAPRAAARVSVTEGEGLDLLPDGEPRDSTP